MSDTKENILLASLRLFAKDGYDAVSVSDIAGELSMTKGALYRHYKNKRDIFDSILARMEQLDALQARKYDLPEGLPGASGETDAAYRAASLKQIIDFSVSQLRYWTLDNFPCSFRKLLTLEQYRSAEMGELYQQYLVSGPLGYVGELFSAIGIADARERAAEFYAPMYLCYSLFDSTGTDHSPRLRAHLERLCREWGFNA